MDVGQGEARNWELDSLVVRDGDGFGCPTCTIEPNRTRASAVTSNTCWKSGDVESGHVGGVDFILAFA